ncbi:MAG: hypothetical protein RLZZ391_179 [Bacteroidota bacterium]|jgi:hypothetical protein
MPLMDIPTVIFMTGQPSLQIIFIQWQEETIG